jgi:hypothetical protein
MLKKSVEHDPLNVIASLPHAHRVSVTLNQLTKGHPLKGLGVTWQVAPVSLHFHLTGPGFGIFVHIERTRNGSDTDPTDLDLPLRSSLADCSHAKPLAVT